MFPAQFRDICEPWQRRALCTSLFHSSERIFDVRIEEVAIASSFTPAKSTPSFSASTIIAMSAFSNSSPTDAGFSSAKACATTKVKTRTNSRLKNFMRRHESSRAMPATKKIARSEKPSVLFLRRRTRGLLFTYYSVTSRSETSPLAPMLKTSTTFTTSCGVAFNARKLPMVFATNP